MNIENHTRHSMSGTGSSILHGLTPMLPMLDLFVRESIQNSYDAMVDGENHINVEFNTGIFNNEKLPYFFEGIQEKLRNVESNKNKFISIKDSNTTGLVGPTTISEIGDSTDWGKFINLIKNFAKSNKLDGAGGSYGHGKSNYYKLGNGLVIYYTRIKKIDNSFEERLMGCVVEQEQNKDGLLYDIQRGNNTGIAWWGKLKDNELYPVTDGDEIAQILDCFNINRYVNNETGTTVIIPYIDEESVLKNTLPDDENDCGSWCKSIEKYIKIAMQRWYPTRYENFNSGQKYINVFINGVSQRNKEMYPLFEIIRHLYNKNFNDIYEAPFEIRKEDIRVQRSFNESIIAHFYYCLLDERDLRMSVPDNYESPFVQINNSKETIEDQSKVIICFCRKPGMILKYDIEGAWSAGIINPEPSKYMIGMVIPRSELYSELQDSRGNTKRITLDEVLRASEGPEHDDWLDIKSYSFDDGSKVDISNFRVVEKMQRSIRTKMNKYSQEKEATTTQLIGTALNRKLAEIFLPKSGFGKRPCGGGSSSGGEGGTNPHRKQSKSKFELGLLQCDENNNLYKSFTLLINDKDINPSFEFEVLTEGKPEKANNWEQVAGDFPIRIISISIEKEMYKNGTTSLETIIMNNDYNSPLISMQRKLTDRTNTWYGFSICVNDGDILMVEGRITYEYLDKSISTSLIRSRGDE